MYLKIQTYKIKLINIDVLVLTFENPLVNNGLFQFKNKASQLGELGGKV